MSSIRSKEAAMWKRICRADKLYKIELGLCFLAFAVRTFVQAIVLIVKAPFFPI